MVLQNAGTRWFPFATNALYLHQMALVGAEWRDPCIRGEVEVAPFVCFVVALSSSADRWWSFFGFFGFAHTRLIPTRCICLSDDSGWCRMGISLFVRVWSLTITSGASTNIAIPTTVAAPTNLGLG